MQTEWSIQLADWISINLPHLILILGLLGASLGLSRNEVIRIDFLQKYYPEKIRKIINPILYLATSITLSIFIYNAYLTSEFDDSKWILFAYIPLLGLLTIKSLLLIFISSVTTNETPDNNENKEEL